MKFSKNNIFLFAGMGLLSFACSVGPKYSRPNTETPQQFRNAAGQLASDTVLLPWRTFYKDPQLVSLIEKALAKNSEVSVALLNMQQLELSYKQAKLGLLPTLDLSVGATRTYFSENSLNGSLSKQFAGSDYLDDYSATLRLSWEADIWGKVKKQKAVAQASYFAQKENLSVLKTRIVVQVAQAYYGLMALDEQLKVAKQNIELSNKTLEMVRLQFAASQVTSLAVQQAEAQKKTAELLVPLALQNIAIQENALSILCGGYPDSITRAGSLSDAATQTPALASGVPATLLSRRPDVKAAELAVMIANTRTGLAKAAMYPTLSLTPSIGLNSYKLNTWFDIPGSIIKTVGANLTKPLFQHRNLKTSYEVAKLEQEKSAVQFKQTMMTAVGEVSNALAQVKYSDERLALVAQKSQSLDKAATDALLLYKGGMATYLEVIVAQNNALQNELEAVNIKRDKLIAITELYRALGGGVE
ncbi:efflux transporter, outer membrane factor (OMF) lipoprotein, NodT family [Flexibacter flexilis DSM 6793]|uniref:Efflux transporter, outer membrane factor (OMF) lipoprotein, NodT family n=1 Tax=Flexibacter flexilis DSM 6793 TaxID=927664 RepID=A0A1I1DFI5_9BACT|nr:TolC family protein [Flexibacter flexilis]SFB73597.1 efflux transporter, outer membrane factor (OMF) lipoprotein, NodT family [Flexibacter flexilis DSM 6793]